ncbi:MAG: hypothetical protein LBL96_10595 [Clostridiales bacterium]|jgi:hypothetical protein|nr:hypothetical protein [Clostridiales bacterium]
MTERELNLCLSRLKRSVNTAGERIPGNMYFFNPLSFYLYIKDDMCFGKQTIEQVMKRIEPFIPLRLSEDNFEIFLDNMLEPERADEIHSELMEKVKGDFIYTVLGANSPETWADITSTCESIRHMKESKIYQTLV